MSSSRRSPDRRFVISARRRRWPVLLAHGVGAREQELLVRLVVAIGDPSGAARRDGSHEALLDAGGLQRRLEGAESDRIASVAGVGACRRTPATARAAGPRRDARVRVGVGGRELQASRRSAKLVSTTSPGRDRCARACRRARSYRARALRALRERVAPPRAIVHAVPHRLATRVTGTSIPRPSGDATTFGDAGAQLVLEAPLVGGRARFAGRGWRRSDRRAAASCRVAREDVVLACASWRALLARENGAPRRKDQAAYKRSRRVEVLGFRVNSALPAGDSRMPVLAQHSSFLQSADGTSDASAWRTPGVGTCIGLLGKPV